MVTIEITHEMNIEVRWDGLPIWKMECYDTMEANELISCIDATETNGDLLVTFRSSSYFFSRATAEEDKTICKSRLRYEMEKRQK